MPRFTNIETEYKRIKTKCLYQLFSEINSIEKLANYLKKQSLYDMLYRDWSGSIHGINIIQKKLSVSKDGYAEATQLRSPEDAQEVTFYAVMLSIMTYRLIIDGRIPKHKAEYLHWHSSIQNLYQQLVGQKLITITN